MKKRLSSLTTLLIVGLLLSGCGMSTGSLNPFGDEASDEDKQEQQKESGPLVMPGEVDEEDGTSGDESADDGEPILLPGSASSGNEGAQDREASTTESEGESTQTDSRTKSDRTDSDQDEGIMLPEEDQEERVRRIADRGHEAYRQGNTEKAIEHYRKAHELDPSKAEYLINLGSLYFNRDQFERAGEYYRNALSRDSDSEKAHLYLGATYRHTGDLEQAREHLRKVLEMNPENDRARNLLSTIDSDQRDRSDQTDQSDRSRQRGPE